MHLTRYYILVAYASSKHRITIDIVEQSFVDLIHQSNIGILFQV